MYDLQPTQPYSLEWSLMRLTKLPRQIVARVDESPGYVRALSASGRLGLVRVQAAGDRLQVAIEGDLDPVLTLQQVVMSFCLDLDLAAAHRHMDAADPVMAGLMRRYNGARPIRPFDLWEALAWAIIGQQVNVAFAYAMKASLVRLGGRAYAGLPAFPEPEVVAALRYEELQAEKYTRKKAEYLIDIARAIAAGELDLKRLTALPYEQALVRLMAIRGVGRWTAECLLMDAGHLDSFPADDIGIRNAVQRFYHLDYQPTGAQVRQIGQPWAPYSALACFYLWLSRRGEE